MSDIGTAFRSHVLNRSIDGCTITRLDDEHIALVTADAVGAVNFYRFDGAPEVVELRIADADTPDVPTFFLHFELEDEARAEELFAEMAGELARPDLYDTTRVLLCCTAGLTTTLFAAKLQEVADTLSLDYRFEARPLAEAQGAGGDYDVVLLAPQVGYKREEIAAAFPDAPVLPIPAKVFASSDAGATLRLVMHLLSDHAELPPADGLAEGGGLDAVRDLRSDRRVMVICVVKRPRSTWIGWRIYDGGVIAGFGSVVKRRQDYRDIEDLLATLHLQGWDVNELDAVGIAVPGVVSEGVAEDSSQHGAAYDLGHALSERYDTRFFVENNANAAAAGCYVGQDRYESVLLYTQQTGTLVGGIGMVVEGGHILRGHRNFAGELEPLFGAVHELDYEQRDQSLAWSSEGMLEIAAPLLAACVSVVAPDAIYVAVDLLDDMDALRDAMAPYFGGRLAEYLPELVRVTDYRERVMLGELALCLKGLRRLEPAPAQEREEPATPAAPRDVRL